VESSHFTFNIGEGKPKFVGIDGYSFEGCDGKERQWWDKCLLELGKQEVASSASERESGWYY
jgi:hypothetical protein